MYMYIHAMSNLDLGGVFPKSLRFPVGMVGGLNQIQKLLAVGESGRAAHSIDAIDELLGTCDG